MDVERLEQSPWFDAEWYRATYPDVVLSGLTPEAHYLRVGERLGRRPCSSFDPRWYLTEYPDIAQAEVSPLLHFIAHGEKEGCSPCGLEAQHWRKQWDGLHPLYLVDMRRVFDEERNHGHCLRFFGGITTSVIGSNRAFR